MNLMDAFLAAKLSGSAGSGSGSAEGGIFFVAVTVQGSLLNVTADKTYAELEAAYAAGKLPVAKITHSTRTYVVPMSGTPGGTFEFEDETVRFTLNSANVRTLTLKTVEQQVTVTGTAPSLAAEDGKTYVCSSALTGLTVTALPASGLFSLVFAAGSAAPEVTLPAALLLPEGFAFEADTFYELSVRMFSVGGGTWGLAAVQSWPVPAAAE